MAHVGFLIQPPFLIAILGFPACDRASPGSGTVAVFSISQTLIWRGLGSQIPRF